ncbi:MAG TPA: IS481 family transposase [Candidatus Limnocylindrales bacterium]
MAHPRARLTVYARQTLVERVLGEGWSTAEVARQLGVSRSTGYKWIHRFRNEGEAGLEDRSSRPHRSPRALSPTDVEAILHARTYRRWGPHRIGPLTGHPRSTVYGVLRRTGRSRLDGCDAQTGIPVRRRRYEVGRPGELIHQDAKDIERVPVAPWHPGSRLYPGTNPGRDHLEVFIDDRTRLACVFPTGGGGAIEVTAATQRAIRWFAAQGIVVERILTDNGSAYCSRPYGAQLTELGIRHSRTRVRRPQTNGKAERFIGTLIREWAGGRHYRNNIERRRALQRYLDFYNRRRPHTALNGLSPLTVLSAM